MYVIRKNPKSKKNIYMYTQLHTCNYTKKVKVMSTGNYNKKKK